MIIDHVLSIVCMYKTSASLNSPKAKDSSEDRLLSNGVSLRRIPKQKRSREKYERIIEVARRLIADKGNDAVSMREIAEASGVVVGTVYQYFPDKNALLWTLLATHFEKAESFWVEGLKDVNDLAALNRLSMDLFELFVGLCKTDRSFVKLWRSIQANSVLQALDDEFNRLLANSYRNKCLDLTDVDDADVGHRLWTMSYLMSTLSSSALHLAFTGSNNPDEILNGFRQLMKQQLAVMR